VEASTALPPQRLFPWDLWDWDPFPLLDFLQYVYELPVPILVLLSRDYMYFENPVVYGLHQYLNRLNFTL